jgi:hypothetical protein
LICLQTAEDKFSKKDHHHPCVPMPRRLTFIIRTFSPTRTIARW